VKKCYACGRKLGKNPHIAICEDEQDVFVGSECYKLIGPNGYQPPLGGPRLYRGLFASDGTLLEVIGLINHPLIGKRLR
jgi:hypothetical protein